MARDFRPGGDPSGGVYAGLNPYPRPRKDRGRGIPTTSGQDVSAGAPNVRLWNFFIEATGTNQRSQAASPRFTGPVFIDRLWFQAFAEGRAADMPYIYINSAANAYANIAAQAVGAAAVGTPIFEYSRGGGSDTTAKVDTGIALAPVLLQVNGAEWKLGKYLPEADIFLAVGLVSRVAVGWPITGCLRILENVDPSTIGDLLMQ